MNTMYAKEWNKTETEVISTEEYLIKRKRIREKERKQQEKGVTKKKETLTPFEFYMVSSLAWT